MKKLIKILAVIAVCFGIVGCSGGKKDLKPEEVYEVLKDNNCRIEISKGDIDAVYAFSKDKKYDLAYDIFEDKSKEILTFTIMKGENMNKLDNIYTLYPDPEEKGIKAFDKVFGELDITVDNFIAFAKWYYENN